MNNLKYAAILCFLFAVILAIVSIIMSYVNRKYFKEICVLYKEKFGELPWMTQVFEGVNSFYIKGAYSFKMDFILMPLLWNKKSKASKNDDKDFIRGLPNRLTRPFRIEYYVTFAGCVFFLALLLLVAIDKYL